MTYIINRKRLLFLALYIVPPIIAATWYYDTSVIRRSGIVEDKNLTVLGTSTEILKNNPQDISEDEYLARASQEHMESGHYDATELLPLVSLPSNFIRYTLRLKNDINLRVSYSSTKDSAVQQGLFHFTLSCLGQEIDQRNVAFKRGLRLHDESADDRKIVEEIMKNCIYFPYGGFKNNIGSIYVHSYGLAPDSRVELVLSPSVSSSIIVILALYAFWIGFLILLREGPGRHVRIISRQ